MVLWSNSEGRRPCLRTRFALAGCAQPKKCCCVLRLDGGCVDDEMPTAEADGEARGGRQAAASPLLLLATSGPAVQKGDGERPNVIEP